MQTWHTSTGAKSPAHQQPLIWYKVPSVYGQHQNCSWYFFLYYIVGLAININTGVMPKSGALVINSQNIHIKLTVGYTEAKTHQWIVSLYLYLNWNCYLYITCTISRCHVRTVSIHCLTKPCTRFPINGPKSTYMSCEMHCVYIFHKGETALNRVIADCNPKLTIV